MRLLFINAGGRVGGAEKSLLVLASALAKRGVEVAISCPEASPLQEEAAWRNLASHGVRLVEHHVARQPFSWVRSVIAMMRLIRRGRFDLVHANGYRAIPTAVPAAWLAGRIPVIAHLRDLTVPPSTVTRSLLRGASLWLAISDAVRDSLRALGGDACCEVLLNAVEIERFDAARAGRLAQREILGLQSNEVAYVFLGRLLRWKGPEDFVHAAGLLSDAAAARFFVVGEEWAAPGESAGLGAELERLAVENGARVQFLGRRDEIPELLVAMDVLVAPSREPEPFGRVALEAMAAGLAVVATRGGGIEKLVLEGETGLLVAPANPQALAAAMRRLLERPELRRELGLAGRSRAKEFTSERHAEEFLRVVSRSLGIGA